MPDSDKAVASDAEAGNYAARDDAEAVMASPFLPRWRLHRRRRRLEVETSRACGGVRGMQLLLLLSSCGAPSGSERRRAEAAGLLQRQFAINDLTRRRRVAVEFETLRDCAAGLKQRPRRRRRCGAARPGAAAGARRNDLQ